MNTPGPPFFEPVTDPEILASFEALPTEDDLPYDDGEPAETARHRDQMIMLIESLKAHWSDRKGYHVGGNMFVHYDPDNKRSSFASHPPSPLSSPPPGERTTVRGQRQATGSLHAQSSVTMANDEG